MKNAGKGFTLLELLVVVLIIGILASIALPQYNKAVEKAKLSEALINIKTIEASVDRYLLTNSIPVNETNISDKLDVDLSGGEWNDYGEYKTENFSYGAYCRNYGDTCHISAVYKDNEYGLFIEIQSGHSKSFTCATFFTEKGQYICHYLESQGWEYYDEEL
ncbi:MAG: prepilin-type N-terminal cleavage/methylation domain-containing protein [Elusimicrobiaceae bacterium]|nr:prepilin-type N-terminal cleavage/methylation domain-containing protein [Elusimicrobiaceae bacterium]